MHILPATVPPHRIALGAIGVAAEGNGHESEIVTPVTADTGTGGDVAAVAPIRTTSAPRPGNGRAASRRTSLRLVPPLRRRRPRRSYGDALFATTLSALLAVGIVGVLLLNTSMQTQADRIQAMRQQIVVLSLQLQQAQTALDRDNSPSALAARATALKMRPAGELLMLRPAVRPPRRLPAAPKAKAVSARARAKTSSHGG